MKRYISTSTASNSILFTCNAVFNVYVDDLIHKVLSASQLDAFPGVEQFHKDIIHMLEKEYKFEVIEDGYDGKIQKGYTSNRPGSVSVYAHTYYNLTASQPVLARLGLTLTKIPNCSIECYIFIRFSDHELNDAGDVLHRNYQAEAEAKYMKPEIKLSFPGESIVVSEKELHQFYSAALEDISMQLDSRIVYWVNKAKKQYPEDFE